MSIHSRAFLSDVLDWDVRSWARAVRFWEHRGGDPSGATVLDLGAGGGGLSLYFALRGARVICSDVADPHRARALIERYGLLDHVEFPVLDATDLDLPSSTCDFVCFKSILGGIGRNGQNDRQSVAMREIHRVLKPGGELFFAENLRGSRLHRYARRRFVGWGDSWNYLTVDRLDELFSCFSTAGFGFHGVVAAFGRNDFQRDMLSYVDSILAPLTPRSHRYIVFGVAKK